MIKETVRWLPETTATKLSVYTAGRSPTFQDLGTYLDGLAGTWEPISSIKEVPTVPDESFDVDLYPQVSLGLAGTWVHGYPSSSDGHPLLMVNDSIVSLVNGTH